MNIKSEKDLNNLIKNKIQEDTNIDYKIPDFSKGESFNKELAKDVSAMANSDGGIIIYGMNEENFFPKEIKWIETDEGYCERVEQIISSKIFRKIENLNVKKIPSNDGTKFVIVIDIPKSDIAPHQVHNDSKQRRYYKRHGSITEQMEHYEIEDLFFKRKRAFLEISLRPCKTENPSWNIVVSNKGKIMAEKVFIKLLVPQELQISDNIWTKQEEIRDYLPNFCTVYQYFDNIMPVYPEHASVIGKLYHPKKKAIIEKLELGFLIVSKNSELKIGKIIDEFVYGEGPKQWIEYSENKEGIPLPSIQYPWSDSSWK